MNNHKLKLKYRINSFCSKFFALILTLERYYFERVATYASYSAGIATSLAVIAQH